MGEFNSVHSFQEFAVQNSKRMAHFGPIFKGNETHYVAKEKEIDGLHGSCFGVPSGPSFRGQNCCLTTQMAGTICPLSRKGMERALITSSSYSSFKSEKRHFYGVSALMGQVGFNSCLMIWGREGH